MIARGVRTTQIPAHAWLKAGVTLLSLFCLAVASAPATWSQVAVPSLVPSAARIGDPVLGIPTANFATINPAAMQWGTPSRWGAGRVTADRVQTAPTAGTTTEYSGLFAGIRKVGNDFSFAVEALQLADDTNSVVTADWNVLNGAVGFLSGDIVTFGVGADRTSTTVGAETLEFNTFKLGLSIQMSTNWFAGVALGTESISSSFDGDEDRSVQMYGIGYRTGGAVQTHFELYVVDKEEADNSGVAFTDVQTAVALAEFNFGNLLVAAALETTDRDQLDFSTSTVSADLGWAPKNGLALTLHWEATTIEDNSTGNEFDAGALAVSFAFQF